MKRLLNLPLYLWLVICFLLPSLDINAQAENANPFDLIHRLDKEEQIAITAPAYNPFDVVPPADILEIKRKEALKEKANYAFEVTRFEGDKSVNKNSLLYLVIPFLILVTLIVSLFRDKINVMIQSARSNNLMNIAHRDSQGRFHPHNVFFYGLSIVSFALYGLLMCINSNVNQDNFIKALIVAITLSFAYLVSKIMLLHGLKSIFPNKNEFSQYIFMVTQYNHLLGLALVPFIIFLAFSTTKVIGIVSIISYVIIGFWWLLRALRSFQIGGKFLTINIFRFFAYLCTVEIAPLIVLYTTIKLILGLNF